MAQGPARAAQETASLYRPKIAGRAALCEPASARAGGAGGELFRQHGGGQRRRGGPGNRGRPALAGERDVSDVRALRALARRAVGKDLGGREVCVGERVSFRTVNPEPYEGFKLMTFCGQEELRASHVRRSWRRSSVTTSARFPVRFRRVETRASLEPLDLVGLRSARFFRAPGTPGKSFW